MTENQELQPQAQPEVMSAEDALSGLFEADIQVTDDTINVTSNSGATVQVPASEPMTISSVLGLSGISPGKDTQVIVDGVPVTDDHMVSPGTAVYLHRMVQGG